MSIEQVREFSSSVIEGGHFYVDSSQSILNGQDFISATQGIEIVKKLYERNEGNVVWWFIDDFHTEEDHINGKATYDTLSKAWGEIQPVIVYEAEPELHDEALALVTRIPDDKKLEYKKSTVLKGEFDSNYGLVKKQKDGSIIPSCNLLDAALYIRKFTYLKEKGGCITVLPEEYVKQQRAVLAILDALNQEIPIINVYFDKEGKISLIEDNQKDI